jgi:hypothetical protein
MYWETAQLVELQTHGIKVPRHSPLNLINAQMVKLHPWGIFEMIIRSW